AHAAAAHRSCKSFHSPAVLDAPAHQFFCLGVRHRAPGTSSPAVECWLHPGNRIHAKRQPRPPSIRARPRSQSPPVRAKQSDSRLITLVIAGTIRYHQSRFWTAPASKATTAHFHSGLILGSIERQLTPEFPRSRARKAVLRCASHRAPKNAAPIASGETSRGLLPAS